MAFVLNAPMVPLALRSGGGSDGCARGFDTSGRPSHWSSPRPCITAVMWGLGRTPAYGHRRRRVEGEVEAYETHSALRGAKQPPPGERPEQLLEAPGPQRCDRTVRGTSVGAPLLAVQSLRGFDGVDDTAAKFLLLQALKMKKEEEEKERKEKEMQEMFARLTGEYLRGLSQPSSSSSPRKRKKRKKKKLPKASSRSSYSRARRRQRQWHSRFADFPGDFLLRAVFPSELLGILAVMNQKDSTTLVVIHGSGICWVGFTGHDAPRVTFPSGVAKPRMLCILAGMDQKDCYDVQTADTVESPHFNPFKSSTPFSWRRGSFSWSRLFVEPWTLHSCCTRLTTSLLCRSSRFISPSWRSGRSYGPDCSSDHGHSTVAVHDGRCPCCAVRAGTLPRRGAVSVSMVQTVRLTMDIPQLPYTVIDVPVAQVLQVPLYSTVSYEVWCSPVEYQTTDFPGSLLQEIFPYSALFGSTVDTYLASLYEASWWNFSLFYVSGWTRLLRTIPVPQILEQIVEVSLFVVTRFIRVCGGGDSRAPTVTARLSAWTLSCTFPSLCNDRCRVVQTSQLL